MKMRLFEGTVQQFREEVLSNTISDTLSKNYLTQIRKNVGEAEKRSWDVSLRVLKDSLEISGLVQNRIIIEYKLPYSERRIDVLLFGRGENTDRIVLVELKQWSNDKIVDCEIDGNVEVDYGKFRQQQAHPSLQVQGYVIDLKDFISVFSEKPKIDLHGCAYCHNYSKLDSPVLFKEKFAESFGKYPIFSKEDSKTFGAHLKRLLSEDAGTGVFNRFIYSPIRPSRKLLEHTNEMLNKQQIFNLLDDQIAAYNAILDRAKKQVKLEGKSVVIVKGGPGTGKSVIALEVMGELSRKGHNVVHATGSSAFTKTLRNIVGKGMPNAAKRFKFFYAFTHEPDNEYDVIISDEAHRIRKNSNDWGVPFMYKSPTPQVDDLIRAARVSVFCIDERQIVRPNEIGSIQLIKESAKKLGVKDSEIYEFELKTQFRCNGSDSYLQWLENILGIRESEMVMLDKSTGMDFKIFDSPQELKQAIELKNAEKKNSARIVAGFCWPWHDPNPDGSLVKDVTIGDFEMPWENKKESWTWATYDEGMTQVGTVYTSQGFEFDYIGVIFSNDLVYDQTKNEWQAKPENSYDKMAKRGNTKFAEHLKNVYRVLMSRAHKGCYVYFMDKNTENLFKSRMEE